MQFKSLQPGNQATITCPLFQQETKFEHCTRLRELVWRGQAPNVRAGCRCAMRASKCPINHMIDAMFRGKDDNFYSAEEKHFAIPQEILKKIAPIQIMQRDIDNYPLSDKEREILISLNANAGATYRKILASEGADEVKPRRKAAEKKPAPKSSTLSATVSAAEKGDISAAITAAASSQKGVAA